MCIIRRKKIRITHLLAPSLTSSLSLFLQAVGPHVHLYIFMEVEALNSYWEKNLDHVILSIEPINIKISSLFKSFYQSVMMTYLLLMQLSTILLRGKLSDNYAVSKYYLSKSTLPPFYNHVMNRYLRSSTVSRV